MCNAHGFVARRELDLGSFGIVHSVIERRGSGATSGHSDAPPGGGEAVAFLSDRDQSRIGHHRIHGRGPVVHPNGVRQQQVE